MEKLGVLKLREITEELAASGKRVKVLWQEPGSLAFVARGREYRSEFHVNDSDEVTYMIKGTMNLHYRTPDGKEEIAVIPEGATNFMPARTPHSPRFPPDAFALILERQRRPNEIDRFHWYCRGCGTFLHEETFVVDDYTKDPVSRAYARFFGNLEARTCKSCGAVMPAP
jgi:3-hydroxyanthranilate 3,4-dioxygenase